MKNLFFQTIAIGLMFVLAIWSVNAYLYTTFFLYVLSIFIHLYYAGNPSDFFKDTKKSSNWIFIYPFAHFGIMWYFDVTFNAMLANLILGTIYYSLLLYNRYQYNKFLKQN